MEHLFVPHELALKLREKGFDEECFGIYYNKDGDVRKTTYPEHGDAPLYQQVLDWFREKYEIDIAVIRSGGMTIDERSPIKFYETYIYQLSPSKVGTGYNYYGALTRAIEEALKLI